MEYKLNPTSLDSYVKRFFDDVLQDNLDFSRIHNDKRMFAVVFKLFGPCSIPRTHWTRLMNVIASKNDFHRKRIFDEVYTPHEEAFIYVILESNFSKWKAECAWKFDACKENQKFFHAISIPKDVAKNSEMIPFPKYTRSRARSRSLFSGWTAEGIEVFNARMDEVDTFRSSEEYHSAVNYSLDNCNNKVQVVKRPRTSEESIRKQEEVMRFNSALESSYKRSKFGGESEMI